MSIKPGTFPAPDALLNSKMESLNSTPGDKAAVQQVSEDFESLLVYFMLRTMRKTIPKSDFLKSGNGDEIMESLFDQELASSIARTGRFGIAEMIQNQLESRAVDSASINPNSQTIPMNRRAATYIANEISPESVKQVEGQSYNQTKALAPFSAAIKSAADSTGVDANLISAVIVAESNGDPSAVSSKGARGLMQLMPATAKELGVNNAFDPEQNILGGARYLATLQKMFGGNTRLTLAAYNAGPGNVRKYGDVPPFPETQRYIEKVLDLHQSFSK